jgi:hypothetical protein
MGVASVNPGTDLTTGGLSAARKQAARLAARTDIRDVRLLRSSAEIVRLPVDEPLLSYEFDSDSAVEYEPGGESFVVRGTYRLSIKAAKTAEEADASDDPAGDVARIEFEHAALFVIDLSHGEDPPDVEELNAYAVTTGQFALHPYVREYVSNVTSRLGLPPLTLGVLRVPLHPVGSDDPG